MSLIDVQQDRQILLVRRIDWRFLLPDPNLGRVGYAGQTEPAHLEALRQFSLDLCVMDRPELDSDTVIFDHLVMNNAPLSAVLKALPRLTPGGYLYWELRRGHSKQGPGAAGRFRHPGHYCRQLAAAGLYDIRLTWHRPNFHSCKELIPLEDPPAQAYALNKGHGSWKGKIKQQLGWGLQRCGLLPYAIGAFSIIARKE